MLAMEFAGTSLRAEVGSDGHVVASDFILCPGLWREGLAYWVTAEFDDSRNCKSQLLSLSCQVRPHTGPTCTFARRIQQHPRRNVQPS